MKRIQFILILTAVMAAVTQGYAEKRIESFRIHYPWGGESTFEQNKFTCHYDNNGRLQKIVAREQQMLSGSPGKGSEWPPMPVVYDSLIYTFDWKPNILDIHISGVFHAGHQSSDSTMTFSLNQNGYADMMVYDGSVSRFFYNEAGEMTDFQTAYATPQAKNYSFIYADNDVNEIVPSNSLTSTCYEYNDMANKTGLNLQLQKYLSNPVLLLADITGKPSARLIKTELVKTRQSVESQSGTTTVLRNIEYEFDQDGFVTKITGFNHYTSFYYPLTIDITYVNTGAVGNVVADNNGISVEGRTAIATDGATISAYDMQGRLTGRSTGAQLELPGNGIYLLRTSSGHTLKVRVP